MTLFSPEKANALIPVLAPLIEDLWKKRQDLAIRLLENDPALRAARAPGPRRTDARRSVELKAEVVAIISRIESYGCIVKDVDLGLLDFPALRDGRAVFLCWRFGEPEIEHWDGADENFGDRKTL